MAEPLLLRIVVGVASLVPVTGGAAGVLLGPAMVGLPSGDVGADSHFRYLSGLLLGLGLMFGATVPRIEQAGPTFRILGTVVIVGGLARLLALVLHGPPNVPTLCALAMELGVTPALMIWQARAAARARSR
ncbi:MAG TPA: DUF4345 domain-containing protein [Stellaceae bacterium]|nr:DUF4345 domain-containing protein [Stellaceae bacterium]